MAETSGDCSNVVTPVFGLTEAQLQPIIDNIANQPVASFHITVEHQVQGFSGYSADKIIPIWEHACSGDLGDALKYLCLDSLCKLPQLQKFAVGLSEPIIYSTLFS